MLGLPLPNDETLDGVLARVDELHSAKGFPRGSDVDLLHRVALLVEEVGEVSAAVTKGTGEVLAEHADVLIVLLGTAVSLNLDLARAAHAKLDVLDQLDVVDVNGHLRLRTRDAEVSE